MSRIYASAASRSSMIFSVFTSGDERVGLTRNGSLWRSQIRPRRTFAGSMPYSCSNGAAVWILFAPDQFTLMLIRSVQVCWVGVGTTCCKDSLQRQAARFDHRFRRASVCRLHSEHRYR